MATGNSTRKKTGSGSGKGASAGKSTGAGSKKRSSRSTAGSSAAKRTRSKTGASSKSGKKQNNGYIDFAVGQEIRFCVVLLVSVLLLLGNIGIIGTAGDAVSGALFGVCGLMAWLFPFVLFFGYSFYVANRRNSLIIRKMVGLVLLFIFLAAFLHLLTLGYEKGISVKELYAVSSEDRIGGGVIGGLPVKLFGFAFNTVGAYILTVFGLVISAIILTQKPLLTNLGRSGRKAARAAGRRRAERRTRKEESRREYEALLDLEEEEEEAKQPGILDYVTLTGKDENETAAKSVSRKGKGRQTVQPAAATSPAAVKPKAEAEPAAPQQIRIDGRTFTMPVLHGLDEAAKPEPAPVKESVMTAVPSVDPEWPVFHGLSEIREGRAPKETAVKPAKSSGTDKKAEFAEIPVSEVQEEENPAEALKPEQTETKEKQKSSTPEERERDIASIKNEIAKKEKAVPVYKLPPLKLLTKGKASRGDSRQHLMDTAAKLQQTLKTFGVDVKVVNVSRGPSVTRYELQPEMGVKVSKILSLQDDIQLNLASKEIRIEAPIPGKAAVGVEVPNQEVSPVMLRDMLESEEFQNSRASMAFAVGKDLGGRPVIADIEKMPHLLIAGATGSGKSVCINTLIMSILYKYTPDQVKMLMIDPKVVELKIYDGIPHLLIPVVTDAKKAAGALNWAVQEMTDRYNKFAGEAGIRDITSYNRLIDRKNKELDEDQQIPRMPRILVIVDELADLMMVASSEVEDAICRLAQLARAAGIHLVIATQRPSVNVVTGLIKANMPSRIALAVSSGVDSRTILDKNGAEKLLGKGDMLFSPQNYPTPARVQGCYVSDEDITEVVKFITSQTENVMYNKEVEDRISSTINAMANGAAQVSASADDGRDEYFAEAGRLIIEKEKASIGMLQRAFKIGFNRAARIMDQLADAGVVGGEEGTKPRKILMTMEEFEQYLSAAE